jgi:outer membrane protein assembly factor BamD (BamD/ComL family)
MRLSFQAALLLLAFATPIIAQDGTPKISQTNALGCTEEIFERAGQSFARRKFRSDNLLNAERYLTEVVRVCADTVAIFEAQDNLRVVHEELADHSLSIALFYLGRFYDGKGGTAGARSRLKSIIEKWPEYSKLDQVLFLLGKITTNDRNFDEAGDYYQRLISTYPGSQYAAEASMRLSAIDMLRRDQSSRPIL